MKPKAWSHPKFSVLQKMLGTSKALTAGILEGLWHLTATFDSDGGTMPHSGDELAAWLEIPIDGETLLDALVDSRWLDRTDAGYVIHDWQDHKPSYIKDAERKARQRRTVTGQSRDSHGTVCDNPHAAAPSDSDSDSELKEKKKRERAVARFVPPTIKEVDVYAQEKGFHLDADKFVDFYKSKGWKVGRNSMKDWKAAVRNAHRDGWCRVGSNGSGGDDMTTEEQLELSRKLLKEYDT